VLAIGHGYVPLRDGYHFAIKATERRNRSDLLRALLSMLKNGIVAGGADAWLRARVIRDRHRDEAACDNLGGYRETSHDAPVCAVPIEN